MMEDIKEIKTFFGKCYCCLEYGYLKILWFEYKWQKNTEIYGKMIAECFAISLEQPDEIDENSDAICDKCVQRLRIACAFKNQVLRAQQSLDTIKQIGIKHEEDNTSFQDLSLYDNGLDSEDGIKEEQGEHIPEVEFLEDNLDDDNNEQEGEVRKPKWVSVPNRNYDKKRLYSESQLRAATKAVLADHVPVTEAARSHGVPRRTLSARLQLIKAEAQWPEEKKTSQISVNRKYIEELKEVAEKHRDNIVTILKYTNATPFRGYSCRTYTCYVCSLQLSDPLELKNHTLTVHGDTSKDIKIKNIYSYIVKLDISNLHCVICNAKFDFLEDVKRHLKDCHGKKMHMNLEPHVVPFRFDMASLKCALCFEQYSSFKALFDHMSEHYKNYKCNECGKYFMTKRLLWTHSRRHEIGIFTCLICEKVCNSRISLQDHQGAVHSLGKSKKQKCVHCGLSFTDSKKTKEHEMREHGRVGHECPECSRRFMTRLGMRYHVHKSHKISKSKCEKCDKEFYFKKDLKKHIAKHAQDRLLCDICPKSFKTTRSLILHRRTHGVDTRYKWEQEIESVKDYSI